MYTSLSAKASRGLNSFHIHNDQPQSTEKKDVHVHNKASCCDQTMKFVYICAISLHGPDSDSLPGCGPSLAVS